MISLVTKMIKAILGIGSGVPVTMVTAPEMDAELEVFKKADETFNGARSTRQTASDGRRAMAGGCDSSTMDKSFEGLC